MAEITKKKPKKYLNNADLLRELELSHAQNNMTDELAKMLLTLCQRYARTNRFANYSYNDDLQSFALLTMCKVWKSFNTTKSQNPFAYFTQVCHHAFFQFDNQERKQRDIRDEILLTQGKPPSFNYAERMSDHDSYGDFDYMEVTDKIEHTNTDKPEETIDDKLVA